MTTKAQDKKLENLIERKVLEFLGDPDNGLTLKKSYVTMLRKRMRKTGKVTPHSAVLKKYGLA